MIDILMDLIMMFGFGYCTIDRLTDGTIFIGIVCLVMAILGGIKFGIDISERIG